MNLTRNTQSLSKTLFSKTLSLFFLQFSFVVALSMTLSAVFAQPFGPSPELARLYDNGNTGNSSATACTTAVDTDNDTVAFSAAIPLAGQEAACHIAGQSTQGLQFSTPTGINQIKFQLMSSKVDHYAVYWTENGLDSASPITTNYKTKIEITRLT